MDSIASLLAILGQQNKNQGQQPPQSGTPQNAQIPNFIPQGGAQGNANSPMGWFAGSGQGGGGGGQGGQGGQKGIMDMIMQMLGQGGGGPPNLQGGSSFSDPSIPGANMDTNYLTP